MNLQPAVTYFCKGHTLLSWLLIRLMIKYLQMPNLNIWFSIFKCLFTVPEGPQEPSKSLTAFGKILSYRSMQE